MFSGLIAYRGRVESVAHLSGGGLRLRIRCDGAVAENPQAKDSIAINGVCLTATAIENDTSARKQASMVIAFDVVPETVERSTLGSLLPNDSVHVEYSLKLGDRIGGHFVYGHVDATAKIISKEPEGQGTRMRLVSPSALTPMLTEKAFVAIDGVSLTVAKTGGNDVADAWFELALIPETLNRTTLSGRNPGDLVNIEVDPLARYAYAALQALRT